MTEEELCQAKRTHTIAATVSTIAFVMATAKAWNADVLDNIATAIGEITRHPGGISPGEYEEYVSDLGTSGLPVSYGMIIDAQGLDDESED